MRHEDAIATLVKMWPASDAHLMSVALRGAPNFDGDWTNKLGSAMHLTVAGNQVTGDYTSAVSGGGGTAHGSLLGYINGSIICFLVHWDAAPSITAWAGHLVKEAGADVIETLWHLPMKMQNPDDPDQLWSSIFTGTDSFTR
jgi:hypothetical protein